MQSGKKLALDTDWVTATAMLLLFFMCLFFAVGNSWLLATGSFRVSPTPYAAFAFVTFLFWMAYRAPEKVVKIGAFVLAVGPIAKIVLWLFRATPETLRLNAVFERTFDMVVYLGACVYVINWFRCRFQWVSDVPSSGLASGSEKSIVE